MRAMFPSLRSTAQPTRLGLRMTQLFCIAATVGSLLRGAQAGDRAVVKANWQADFVRRVKGATPAKRGPPQDWEGKIPLVVTNNCSTTIWPGIATQAGTGPGTGGFELQPGQNRTLWVGAAWQGRVWGRTNCTVNGDSCACKTGDCFAKLDCGFSGAPPATLAEFNLAGGVEGTQTFYDISLVDGYNLPMGISYLPAKNTTYIPPNLTNCACIATAGWLYDRAPTGTYYANATFPVPLEANETNESVSSWCPWPNLVFPPAKPRDGVYPYPDDKVERPAFSPCKSACAATGSDKDCCIGKYHDAKLCKPSLYSSNVKAVCPDAYSFAFDDQKSTFIIPKGGGWEVIMCPTGRSTNILRQLGKELYELASGGKLSDLSMKRLRNVAYVDAGRAPEAGGGRRLRSGVAAMRAAAVVAAVGWLTL